MLFIRHKIYSFRFSGKSIFFCFKEKKEKIIAEQDHNLKSFNEQI